MKLELTNRILRNSVYQSELNRLQQLEQNRIFCGHDIAHSLDVARIALIICQEKGMDIMPDLIYSAALLHDIGRCAEYTENTPHHIAGKETAAKILDEVSCPPEMKQQILSLVVHHRHQENEKETLENIFYLADKKSRLCFFCPAEQICNWSEEQKNMNIEV